MSRADSRAELSAALDDFRAVRTRTDALCAPLLIEDFGLQAMADVSPPKWHLAHTSWFFEQFLLQPYLPGYRVFDPAYAYLFNSYYETVGTFFPRAQRGLLSRPCVAEVMAYRRYVNEAMLSALDKIREEDLQTFLPRLIQGLHHEQQHQELLLTDIQYNFSINPTHPAYHAQTREPATALARQWLEFPAGQYAIGHHGPGFAFDNESPAHRVYLQGFSLANSLVNNAEYREFMQDGGYHRPELWLSDGWQQRRDNNWQAPLYWQRVDEAWRQFDLTGLCALDPQAAASHLSFYEADAYARWAGKRLPTEFEWEVAALAASDQKKDATALQQLFGVAWQWTGSAYLPYPGYRPAAGALGEYNGKFMCNQMVLRGGSALTADGHSRASYRNFFPPAARWQLTGLRLANDSPGVQDAE